MDSSYQLTTTFTQQQITLVNKIVQSLDQQDILGFEQIIALLFDETNDTSDNHYYLALILMEHQHYTQALSHFEKAYELTPDQNEYAFRLGLCYQHLSEYDKAINYYKESLSIPPAHPLALGHLSYLYYNQRQLDAAEDITTQWIRTFPTNSDAYNMMGCIFLQKKDYQEAVSQFRQALEFDINHYQAMSNLVQDLREHVYQCR